MNVYFQQVAEFMVRKWEFTSLIQEKVDLVAKLLWSLSVTRTRSWHWKRIMLIWVRDTLKVRNEKFVKCGELRPNFENNWNVLNMIYLMLKLKWNILASILHSLGTWNLIVFLLGVPHRFSWEGNVPTHVHNVENEILST